MPTGTDAAHGSEPVVVRHITSPKDLAIGAARAAGAQVLEGRYTVQKYWGDVSEGRLYEVVETDPNLFLTAGINTVLLLAAGQAATAFSGSNARLAVGNNSTSSTPVAGQTDLQGASTYRQIVDSAPVIATNTITFVATFGTGVANFVWAEVGVVNASSAGQMWSRSVPAGGLGTKTSAASWVLNWQLSIA